MEQQMWTKGPSLPSGMPEPRLAVSPITLAQNILMLAEEREILVLVRVR